MFVRSLFLNIIYKYLLSDSYFAAELENMFAPLIVPRPLSDVR